MSIFISTFTFLILSISVLLISASFILPSVPLFLGLLSQMCIPAFRPFIHQPTLSLIPPPPQDRSPSLALSTSRFTPSCSNLAFYPPFIPSRHLLFLQCSNIPPSFPDLLHLPVNLSIHLFISLSVYLSSVSLPLCLSHSPPHLPSQQRTPHPTLLLSFPRVSPPLPPSLSIRPSLPPSAHPPIHLPFPPSFVFPPSTCSPGPVPSFILPRLSPPQELRRVRLLCQSCQSEPRLRRTWDPCFVDKLFGD